MHSSSCYDRLGDWARHTHPFNKEAAPVAYLAGRIKRVQLAGYATVNPVSPEQIERAARLVLAGKIRFSVASAKLAWESAETGVACHG